MTGGNVRDLNADIRSMDMAALRHLTLSQGLMRDITPEEFDHIFKTCDALWLHNGDPKAPHAELTSGKCSDGFVDVLRVLKNANLCEIFSYQLMRRYLSLINGGRVDWIIGSDHAGATLSYSLAVRLMAQHDFTEKGDKGTADEGKQIWKRFRIEPEEEVLQVEELVTTTKTLQAVRDGIREGNAKPVTGPVTFKPFVLCLVHRSDIYFFDNHPIVYVRHFDIKTWEPKDCPLCAVGSPRIKPKKNWAQLTGRG